MDLVLRGLNWDTVLAFLDDIVVLGRTVPDHLHNLQEVLRRFSQYGLKLKTQEVYPVSRKGRILGQGGQCEQCSAERESCRGSGHVAGP